MAPEVYTLIAFLVIVAAYLLHRILVGGREFRKFSGKMLVTCPETHQRIAVKVATGRAALAATVGKQHVELSECTRWPERKDCDQACLCELEADPQAHSVWTIAAKWYAGKNCVYCGRPIAPFSHLDHPPALIGADDKIVNWDQITPERLPEELAAGRPVCWNCGIIEGFRQHHPELVIERPWKH